MKNLNTHFYLRKNIFNSSLRDGKRGNNDGYISNEQYLHLQIVSDTFNFNTFKDFHDDYLKKDVLLLADVFEKFICTCLKYYRLDPCHFLVHLDYQGLLC